MNQASSVIQVSEEGFLDENGKILSKEQLHFRIFLSQQRVKELEGEIKKATSSQDYQEEYKKLFTRHNNLAKKYVKAQNEIKYLESKSNLKTINSRQITELRKGGVRLVNFLVPKSHNKDCRRALALFLNCLDTEVGEYGKKFLDANSKKV